MIIVLLLQIFILVPAYILSAPGIPFFLGALLYVAMVLILSIKTEDGRLKKEHNTLGWLSIAGTILIPVMMLIVVIVYFSTINYIGIRIDDAKAVEIGKHLLIFYYLVNTVALGNLFEKEKGPFDLVFTMVFGSINALTCYFFIQLIFETVNGYINLLF